VSKGIGRLEYLVVSLNPGVAKTPIAADNHIAVGKIAEQGTEEDGAIVTIALSVDYRFDGETPPFSIVRPILNMLADPI
jgi:hypothetical protein